MTASRISLDNGKDWLIGLITSETFVYIIKRILQALLTLFLASALSFFVMQLAPGDFVTKYEGDPKYTEDFIKQIRQQFALDQPWHVQYFLWLWNIISKGDFGPSMSFRRPVISLLWERVPATLLIAISSLIFTWLIAIPLGIIGAVKQNSFVGKILLVLSYLGQGVPSFIIALFLLFFAQVTTPLFPVGGRTSINHSELNWFGQILDVAWHMILPTIALSVTSFAGLQRITRGEFLDVMRQDYIQTARAKGLPENRVIYVHALRNAINPLITLLGFEFASLLSGAFITEQFFNWPGLGRLTYQALLSQDIFLAMASLMMGAVMLIVGNLIADVMLKFADPRIKLEDLN
ncbi:MAG: ABC transporter permease [Scytonematopsis contorta HA4267-MV1]|jgi:peptide/nickel transport system permease protein|nr:ABC transporter permease [Scytonematopsis contorta HA4267-MV1]